jgi:hypothetical protein
MPGPELRVSYMHADRKESANIREPLLLSRKPVGELIGAAGA